MIQGLRIPRLILPEDDTDADSPRSRTTLRGEVFGGDESAMSQDIIPTFLFTDDAGEVFGGDESAMSQAILPTYQSPFTYEWDAPFIQDISREPIDYAELEASDHPQPQRDLTLHPLGVYFPHSLTAFPHSLTALPQAKFSHQNSSIDQTVSPNMSNSASPSQPLIFQTSSIFEWMPETFGLPRGHRDYKEANANLLHVVDSLGHGSLGVVEEVRVSVAFPSFVRKRVRIPFNQRTRYLDIIKQESQMLQDLSHRHIVKMLGTYAETPENSIGRQFYSLLMAPVGERDLKTFLEIFGDMSTPGPVELINDPWVWLKSWFRCLSSALAYLHSRGVRHQDIKPSNIIHRGSEIYFTDFSSASQFEIGQTTSTENPARTSAMYAAPEVIDNDDMLNRHGRGTDVFALGAVFTEMLAVLDGHSIEEYHNFLASSQVNLPMKEMPSSSIIPRKTFHYGRKLERIAAFFGKQDSFYHNYIAPMLRVNRKSRPDAEAVAGAIREEYSCWPLPRCSC